MDEIIDIGVEVAILGADLFSGNGERSGKDYLAGLIGKKKEVVEDKSKPKYIISEDEVNHIKWIYDRLINVHKESPDVDYMIKLKEITVIKK